MDSCGSGSSRLGPAFAGLARRVVSLVPSLTDAMFALGAGGQVVGRTDYCVRPAGSVGGVEAVGGPKNPDVGRILALAPDLVLASREENTRGRVERLAEEVPVLLTDPAGPVQIPALWRELGTVCGCVAAAGALAGKVEAEIAAAAPPSGETPPGFVYWIWRDPWMAAGHGTYISELLRAAGWHNALPAELLRYPRVDPEVATALAPRAMLFASEPWAFRLPDDLDAFPGQVSGDAPVWRIGAAVALEVDGQAYSWYPSRTAAGLREAADLRRRLAGSPPG
jgi:ABC-type Fe3+-hydroxamate transport system substrate-binding protein